MNKAQIAGRFSFLALALFLLAVLVLPLTASADTYPYVKADNADVFTGGAFENSSGDCSANYSRPNGSNSKLGGIFAYATTSQTGAGTNLGAISVGPIDADATRNYGFLSNQQVGAGRYNHLSFANQGASASLWGGNFEGATAQSHCIPDYWSKQSSPTTVGSPNTVNLNNLANGQHLANPVQYTTLVATTIAAGKKVTLFVDGDVYIAGNINFAPVGNYNTSATQVAVVARGNIYVGPAAAVNDIRGWFIAQPDPSNYANTGYFVSCYDIATYPSAPQSLWVTPNCAGNLHVRGAVTAKQVKLLRVNGTIASSNSGEIANPASATGNIAEWFEYDQLMLAGGNFFSNSTTNQALKIDSLISLPPVF